jgi:hypothetical protein
LSTIQKTRLGGGVGLFGHHLGDEAVEWFDAALGLAAVEQLRPPHVPGGQVAERAHPLVLVLDQLPVTAGKRCRGRMQAGACLDRRLLNGSNAVANFEFERSVGRPPGRIET